MDKFDGNLVKSDNPSIVYKAHLVKSPGRSDGRMTGFIVEKDDGVRKRVIVFPNKDSQADGQLSGVMIRQGSSNKEYVRGMMQAQQVTPIERLRQLGCIFWFPLDLDNGLNDVVGGYEIAETYNDAFVYNSNYGHLAKVRQHQQVVANININISDYNFIDDNYTTITQYRRYSTQATTAANAMIFHTQSGIILIGLNASGTAVTNNWDTNIQTTVLVARRDGRTIYNNGNVVVNDSYVYPSISNDSGISVYDNYNYNFDRYVYCRNMMLFRKALTSSEIAEVMQIAGITW